MKTLFDSDERYTQEALKLEAELLDAMKHIIEKYAQDHKIREIGVIAHNAVNDLILTELL